MGTPDIAATCLKRLLTEGFDGAAVYTRPDRPKGRGMKMVYSPVKEVALTAGLPVVQMGDKFVKTTEMLALNIYNTFYTSGAASPGVAQAKAVIFFVLVAGLGLAQLTFTRNKEVQQ